MTSLVSNKTYNTPALSSEEIGIPESLSTQIQPKLTEIYNQYVNVPSTSGNSFSDGGQFSFQLPTVGYLESGSLNLRFNVQFNYTGSGVNWSFAGSSASCGQLFNRISAQCGSIIIDDIQNYFSYHSLLLESCSMPNYAENTANINEGCYSDATPSTNGGAGSGIAYSSTTIYPTPYFSFSGTSSYSFNMNVCLPFLNSGRSFPLFLLQAPMILTFYLNTSSNAFVTTGAVSNTSFTLSNPSINYHQLCLPRQLELSIKDTMRATGRLYEMNLGGVNNYINAVPANSSVNYNLSTQLASLNAVAYVAIQNLGVQTASKYFFKPETQDTTVNSRLYCNSNQVLNFACNSDDIRLGEWRRALSGVFNFNTVHRYAYNNTAFGRPSWNSAVAEGSTPQTRGYINGFNLRRLSEDNVSFGGTETHSLILNLDRNTSTACTYFIYLFYDKVITISADGMVSVNC